jgi:hypothetical protein
VRCDLGYLPSDKEVNDEDDDDDEEEEEELSPLISIPGTSMLRTGIRNFIATNEVERPAHNLSRREREELGEQVVEGDNLRT